MLTARRKNKIWQVAKRRQSGLIVVLEDIHDPHNAAAVLRTCDAFGVQEVYFIFDLEEKYSPKKIGKSTSASANKWLDIKIFRSVGEVYSQLKKKGYQIYASAISAESASIFQTDFVRPKKIALVIGNEHRGLSADAIKHADKLIAIPMRGMVQSLNLSVTAAILIFEVLRQRQKSKKPFTLSKRHTESLTRRWQKRA